MVRHSYKDYAFAVISIESLKFGKLALFSDKEDTSSTQLASTLEIMHCIDVVCFPLLFFIYSLNLIDFFEDVFLRLPLCSAFSK
jgi:hypothetical protein